MRRFWAKPYAQLEPCLIEIQPGGRPWDDVLVDEAAIIPVEDVRMKEAQPAVLE